MSTLAKPRAQLLDYAATKGAIVSFTRSLAQSLADKGIRVNTVASGSEDGSYVTGQVLHLNGGSIVNT